MTTRALEYCYHTATKNLVCLVLWGSKLGICLPLPLHFLSVQNGIRSTTTFTGWVGSKGSPYQLNSPPNGNFELHDLHLCLFYSSGVKMAIISVSVAPSQQEKYRRILLFQDLNWEFNAHTHTGIIPGTIDLN